MLPQKNFQHPNATSLNTVHGGSNTAVRHDTRQSSRSVSVITIVDLVRVGPDEVGIYRRIDDQHTKSFYIVLQFETI